MSFKDKYRWQPLAMAVTCLLASEVLYAQDILNFGEQEKGRVLQKESEALELGRVIIKAEEEAGYGKSAGGVASVSLSKEQVERFRGTGNGDVFQGISGLQVNSVRNEAGALDVGIRGIQGEGRVPVYIDGSLQSTHTFRGYQGESDRTYIDMDLISTVTTEKGASIGKYGTGAVGGLVQMKTLGVDDIVKPDQKYGFLVKGSIFNNNKSVHVPSDEKGQANYRLTNHQKGSDFRNGAFTLGFAYKGEMFDFVSAYNHRKVGNYFAGKHGRDRLGAGVNDPKAGQEVPNTSYQSDSGIVKFGYNITDEQRIEVNLRRHVQRAGEVLAVYFGNWPRKDGYEYTSQWEPGSAQVNTGSIEYRYNPFDNSLIDLNVNLWGTKAKMHQFNGQSGIGNLGDQYRGSYKDGRRGLNIENNSILDTIPIILNYGLTFEEQKVNPRSLDMYNPSARNAKRQEKSAFLNMNYDANIFDFGVSTRLHKSSITDYNGASRVFAGGGKEGAGTDKRRFNTKFDWSGNLAFHLNDNIDLYARYSNTYRNPSLFEGSISGQTFSYDPQYPLKAENARTYEVGFMGNYQDLIGKDDRLSFGINYFHNDMRNFITAGEKYNPDAPLFERTSYTFENYSKYLSKGFELNFSYDHSSFFVDANATFYKAPTICAEADNCGQYGFSWSLIPARIPTKKNIHITVGKHFFNKSLTVGGRWNYHSRKTNPKGWMSGTGITGRAVEYIPSEKIIDLFAKYSLNRDTELTMNIDNLTNRYTLDPGTVIGMPQPGRTIRLGFEMKF